MVLWKQGSSQSLWQVTQSQGNEAEVLQLAVPLAPPDPEEQFWPNGGPLCPFLHLPSEKTAHGQTVCNCLSLDLNPGSPTLHAAGFMLGLQDIGSSPRFSSQPVCDPGQVI